MSNDVFTGTSPLTTAEQETAITIDRTSKTALIYSSDQVMIRRLKRLLALENTELVMIAEDKFGIAVELPKNMITIRGKRTKMSDEQRQAASERLKKARGNL